MNDVVMEVHNLVYSFDGRLLFNGLNFDVKQKHIVSVVGTNNSGKTTLIRILGAVYMTDDAISVSKISLSERTAQSYRKSVSYIDFDNLKFSSNTVFEELLLLMENFKWNDNRKEKSINTILEKLNLNDYKYKQPSRLSKKHKISVLLAKALLLTPKVLVMSLNSINLSRMDKDYIFSILEQYVSNGMSVIFETNDSEDILYSDRMMVLHNGDIAIEGSTINVLKKDGLLLKLGVELPFIVDLSLKLKFYDVIDKIYFNEEELVNKLWK